MPRIKGTQRDWVRQQLLAGKRLTHTSLISNCGGKAGWRLGAVIYEIANDPDEPLPIQREYSGRRRMATYWLAGDKPGQSQLELPIGVAP